MLIGYARGRAASQGLDLQKEVLDRAGVDRLFADVGTAAGGSRPQLELALSGLRRGDTLVVCKLDRIGRSLEHLIEMVEDLSRRGIGFRSIEENVDTMTSMGKLVFSAFLLVAAFERDLAREENEPRRAKAQARRRRGRKPKLNEKKQALVVVLYKDPTYSVADVCHKLGISQTTLYRYLAGSQPEDLSSPDAG